MGIPVFIKADRGTEMTIENTHSDILKSRLLSRLERLSRRLRLSSLVCRWLCVILQILSVISGIIVAIITAANTTLLGIEHNTAIVIVSGAGSASAALLGRLRLNDVARAKEIGRIGVEDMILKTEWAFIEASSKPESLSGIYNELRHRIRNIEYDQVNLNFPSRKEAEHEGRAEAGP